MRRRCPLVELLLHAALVAHAACLSSVPPSASSQQAALITRVCDIPTFQQLPYLLRRPLASLAVRKGLPLIDEDRVLCSHILAGRTSHPVFIQRFAAALDDALDLSLLVSSEQQKALVNGVATVLLTPSDATRSLLVGLDARAIGLAPTLRDKAARIELASAINRAIDLPLMDEAAEQVLFEQLVDAAAELVEQLLPGELQDALLTGSERDVSHVRAVLVERLTPQIVRRLPMTLLTRFDETMPSARFSALPTQIAESITDATLAFVREARPDEFLSTDELRHRLEVREAATLAEISRVEEEAASVLSELRDSLEEVRRQRLAIDDMGEVQEQEEQVAAVVETAAAVINEGREEEEIGGELTSACESGSVVPASVAAAPPAENEREVVDELSELPAFYASEMPLPVDLDRGSREATRDVDAGGTTPPAGNQG